MINPNSLVGKQIDQFRLDEYIARGAMGMVFKAFDTILVRTVALKLISKLEIDGATEEGTAGREEARKRLIQEAKAAGRLSHPNIVTIHCYGETSEFDYICMEYVDGKTLTKLLNERKWLSPEEAVAIFDQILQALVVAHRESVVHRDLKPSNIMITTDKRVKVMDFGIAKLPSLSMTAVGTILGTPHYMSPEQISGQEVDVRSDIFSLGAVFYEVLTGERPFTAENTGALIYKILQVQPVPARVLNVNIPEPLGDIIHKALAKDPASRFQNPTEMLEALRAVSASMSSLKAMADATAIMDKSILFEETIQVKSEFLAEQTVMAAPKVTPRIPVDLEKTIPSTEQPKETSPKAPVSEVKIVEPTFPPAEPVKEKVKEKAMPPPREPEKVVQPKVSEPAPKKEEEPLVTGGKPKEAAKPPAVEKGGPPKKEISAKQTGPGKTLGLVFTVLVLVVVGIFFWMRSDDTTQVQPPTVSQQPIKSPVPTPPPVEIQVPVERSGPGPGQVPPATTVQPPPIGQTQIAVTQPPPVVLPPQTDQPPQSPDQIRASVENLILQAKNQWEVNPAAAQQLLEQAVALDPYHFDAVFQLARLLTYRKDFTAAIKQYQTAMQLNGQIPEIYFNLGYIYLGQGAYDLAIENYEVCRALSPPYMDEVLTNLGIAYWKKKNLTEARVRLKQALELNPNNEKVKNLLSLLDKSPAKK